MLIPIPLDDLSGISNDIEKAQARIAENFKDDAKLSDCENFLEVHPTAIREVKDYLLSAAGFLQDLIE